MFKTGFEKVDQATEQPTENPFDALLARPLGSAPETGTDFAELACMNISLSDLNIPKPKPGSGISVCAKCFRPTCNYPQRIVL